MSSERIMKYHDDIQLFITNNNTKKLINEINKLTVFIQKHQNEIINDTSKQKLLNIIEITHRHNKFVIDIDLNAVLFSLMSDYLALPEGKLVGSKMKKKVLSLYDNYTGILSNNDSYIDESKWIVADVDNINGITLMKSDCNSDDVLENVQTISMELFDKIYDKFNSDHQISVKLTNNNIIAGASLSDNTEL